MTDIEKRAEEFYHWDKDGWYKQAFTIGYSEGYEKGIEAKVANTEAILRIHYENKLLEDYGWLRQENRRLESKLDTLQQRVKELEGINTRWVEKYNYDYDRVVPLIRQTMETGDKLISVQDTVIAIGKLMDEVERLKNENGNLELALRNM